MTVPNLSTGIIQVCAAR